MIDLYAYILAEVSINDEAEWIPPRLYCSIFKLIRDEQGKLMWDLIDRLYATTAEDGWMPSQKEEVQAICDKRGYYFLRYLTINKLKSRRYWQFRNRIPFKKSHLNVKGLKNGNV